MQQNTIVRLLTTTIKFPNLCTCMIIEIHFIECTEVQFASFFSGGFITAIVVNPPERRLTKRTSVQCHENLSRTHSFTNCSFYSNFVKKKKSVSNITCM